MIVWGGLLTPSRQGSPFANDGAAYVPQSRTWLAMSDAPLAPRSQHVAIWSGQQMIVWGGLLDPATSGGNGAADDGAALDPTTGIWTMLPPAPITGRVSPAVAWTGTEMVIWGGDTSPGLEGQDVRDGAAFDPARRVWRKLAAAPLPQGSLDWALWTGRELLVTTYPEAPGAAVVTSAYEPSSDTWTTPAATSTLALFTTSPIQVGTGILVYGPRLDETPNKAETIGQLYDPVVRSWGLVAGEPPSRSLTGAVWTDREAIVVGSHEALAAGCSDWRTIADEPNLPTEGFTSIWTGDALLVWGGLIGESADRSREGYSWRP